MEPADHGHQLRCPDRLSRRETRLLLRGRWASLGQRSYATKFRAERPAGNKRAASLVFLARCVVESGYRHVAHLSSCDPAPTGGGAVVLRHVLVFPPGGVDRLREKLLADVPLEAAHFLFARPVRT